MKNRTKNLLALGAVALGVCFVSGFNLLDTKVKADVTPDMVMGQVADVRLGEKEGDIDKTGVRFNLFMSVDKYEALSNDGAWLEGVSVGALVMPTDLLGENALETDTPDVVNIPLDANMWRVADAGEVEEAGIADGEYMTSYAVLYNVPEVCYDWELTAVGYYDPTTELGDTVYTANACKRSMAQVAFEAIQKGEDENKLDAYLPSYEVSFMQGQNTLKSTFVKYGSLATLGEVVYTPSAGKIFAGWEDENGNPYDLSTPVTSDLTLKAVEKSPVELLDFNSDASLAVVSGATSKAIVKDGDKSVLRATFGGSNALKIDLGSIYKIFGIHNVEIVYSIEEVSASGNVEVWFNNLGNAVIWDKIDQFNAVVGETYQTIGVYGKSTKIDKASNPTLEAIVLKSAATVTIKIDMVVINEVWNRWEEVKEDFTGNPELLLADFGDTSLVAKTGFSAGVSNTWTAGDGVTIKGMSYGTKALVYTFPKPVSGLDYLNVYFEKITSNAKLVIYLLNADNKQWYFETSGSALASGGFVANIKVSNQYGCEPVGGGTPLLTQTMEFTRMYISSTDTAHELKIKQVWATKMSYNYSNYNKQIGDTNEYVIADFADGKWLGRFGVVGSGSFSAVRNTAGALTGYQVKVAEWNGAGAIYYLPEAFDYSTLDTLKIYHDCTDAAPSIAVHFIDEIGNYYWNGGSFDTTTGATWGKKFVASSTSKDPETGIGTKNNSVKLGANKIVAIAIVCRNGNTYNPLITKITYTKK